MYFYLSLGSNIDAEKSAAEILRRLCLQFGSVAAYPFRYTKPEGVVSDELFLNAIAVVRTELNSGEVKARLNQIEEAMGRDRSDPQRSTKSRTADIDILASSASFNLEIFEQAKEAYVRTCYHLGGPGIRHGLAAYKRPSTVHLDALTGNVVIVEDELQGFKNGLKAALEGQ